MKKKKYIVFMAVALLSMTACGKNDEAIINQGDSNKTPVETSVETPTQAPVGMETATPTATATATPTATQPPVATPEATQVAAPTETYETGAFSFTIPASWVGKYKVEVSSYQDSTWYSFIHVELSNQGVGGRILSIVEISSQFVGDLTMDNLQFLGQDYSTGKAYYMGGPTDVQFGSPDNAYYQEYQEMSQGRGEIISTFQLKNGQTAPTAEDQAAADYIFPTSDVAYITPSELANKTAGELELGRNEIFARHGYAFQEERIRSYFQGKSWYSPTIQPDEFYQKVTFNEYEKENIAIIQAEEAKH